MQGASNTSPLSLVFTKRENFRLEGSFSLNFKIWIKVSASIWCTDCHRERTETASRFYSYLRRRFYVPSKIRISNFPRSILRNKAQTSVSGLLIKWTIWVGFLNIHCAKDPASYNVQTSPNIPLYFHLTIISASSWYYWNNQKVTYNCFQWKNGIEWNSITSNWLG